MKLSLYITIHLYIIIEQLTKTTRWMIKFEFNDKTLFRKRKFSCEVDQRIFLKIVINTSIILISL